MEKIKDFGVLYGQKTTEDALLIYSSYEDYKASPRTGAFIVLAPADEFGDKYLARVDAEIYDEDPIFRSQDKTLIAVHYARIAERELSDRDKQKIFSYTYKVKILGTFRSSGTSLQFTTAVRKLPTVSYHARQLDGNEVKNLLNHGNRNGIAIGNLCTGDDYAPDKDEILFDINKLRDKRTMIFAQSGFGKTNLMKVMLYHMMSDRKYGKLIFDLNGEYFKKSDRTYGIGDINQQKVRDNLVVYTDKRLEEKYRDRFIHGGKVLLNTHKHLTVGDLLNFGTGFSDVMKSFLLYLDDEGVTDFIENIDKFCADPAELHKRYPDFLQKLPRVKIKAPQRQ